MTLFDDRTNNLVDTKANEYAVIQEKLQCDRPNALISTRVCMFDARFCVRVRVVKTVTGKQLWLTLFDERMNNLVDPKANEYAVIQEKLQCDRPNALISTRVCITLKKWQRGRFRTVCFSPNLPLSRHPSTLPPATRKIPIAVLKDWLIVLVNANVKLSDLTADQMCAVKCWLHDSNEEAWEKCVRNMNMAVLDGDLSLCL